MPWSVRAIPLPDGDQPCDLWIGADGGLATRPVPGTEPLPGRYVAPGLLDAHAHPAVAPGPAATPRRWTNWPGGRRPGSPWSAMKPSGTPVLTYSVAAIEAMTAAVHAAGGRVAAHVTTDAVTPLVRAGVDSVEHGTAVDEPVLRLMAQAGVAWTPTLCAVLAVPGTAPEAARRRVAEYRERLCELLPAGPEAMQARAEPGEHPGHLADQARTLPESISRS